MRDYQANWNWFAVIKHTLMECLKGYNELEIQMMNTESIFIELSQWHHYTEARDAEEKEQRKQAKLKRNQ